ncbi:MAG: hypothetical protein K0S61_1905 [Anaerocolumna sp.]|jgi:hypothetical protein|nr:hypothetical protein [Anaerocolumna sp.]
MTYSNIYNRLITINSILNQNDIQWPESMKSVKKQSTLLETYVNYLQQEVKGA